MKSEIYAKISKEAPLLSTPSLPFPIIVNPLAVIPHYVILSAAKNLTDVLRHIIGNSRQRFVKGTFPKRARFCAYAQSVGNKLPRMNGTFLLGTIIADGEILRFAQSVVAKLQSSNIIGYGVRSSRELAIIFAISSDLPHTNKNRLRKILNLFLARMARFELALRFPELLP